MLLALRQFVPHTPALRNKSLSAHRPFLLGADQNWLRFDVQAARHSRRERRMDGWSLDLILRRQIVFGR